MARINIDEEIFTDPRFGALRGEISEAEALGALVLLWRLGQQYWKKKPSPQLIPRHLFDMLPHSERLVRYSFAVVRNEGVYCSGSEERWSYLKHEQKVAAGKKSADARRKKTGSAQPNRPERTVRNLSNETRTKINEIERYSYSSSYSSSSSSSSPSPSASFSFFPAANKIGYSSEGGADAPPTRDAKSGANPLNGKTWAAYAQAYYARYQTEPVRNATVNGQIARLVKRLGEEAPDVIAFYILQNRAYYLQSCHPVGLCLKDAEALRTQWAKNTHMLPTHARQLEQRAHNSDVWDRAAETLAATKSDQGEA